MLTVQTMRKVNSRFYNRFNQSRHRIPKAGALFIVLWVVLQTTFGPALWSGPLRAAAQTSNENWTTPVNLSHSGSASNPLIVVTDSGQFHVIWSDLYAGYIHTTGDGVQWSEPAVVRLPFSTFTPHLVTDAAGYVHALWLDDENILFYSRVKAENFSNPVSWATPLRLATAVLDMDMVAGSNGSLHLSYVQGLDVTDQVAGVYYRRLASIGASWSVPVLLYESPYFRSLTRENANIKIATAASEEGERLYVAWDNPLRVRIFTTRSLDEGKTWDAPLEVDAPAEGTFTGGPGNVIIEAEGDSVLLIWQTNRYESNCLQYYQWSLDGGSTWQPRQPMLDDLPGCPQKNQVIGSEAGNLFLLSTINTQIYLLAWDGARWSNAQLQASLSGFIDPETFNPVEFDCRQAVLVGEHSMFMVGCDAGVGKDIWITSRSLEDVSGWFSDAPLWSSPAPLTTSQNQMHKPILIADENNRIHAFWSQADNLLSGVPGNVIYYTRLETGQWSQPEAILTSPTGDAEQPAATVNAEGNLLLVWSGGESGQIYFSQATAARAVVPSAWTEPQQIPSPQPVGSAPDILFDRRGIIYVVYAIPLNEQRGIYITQSADDGLTWSDPVLVFDAAAAEWAMVDNPQLAMSANGQLYLTWTRYSIPSGAGSLGLYYASSTDGGLQWSQAQTVVEKPVVWSKIVGLGEGNVHRVWQELSNGRTILWHEQSQDQGNTWERIVPVSIFGSTIGEPALATDRAGRLHLLQVVNRGVSGLASQSFVLQHWMFDGERWITEMSLNLNSTAVTTVESLVAAVSHQGDLAVVFTGGAVNQPDGSQLESLIFTNRLLELPAVEANPTLEVLPTVTPQPIPTATAMPQSSPTPNILVSGSTSGSPGSGEVRVLPEGPEVTSRSIPGSVVGPIAAAFVVLIVFIIGVRGAWFGRR